MSRRRLPPVARAQADLAPERDGAVRRRYAELAEQHAAIFDLEASNQEAEAGRAAAEAASADARATAIQVSADAESGAGHSPP